VIYSTEFFTISGHFAFMAGTIKSVIRQVEIPDIRAEVRCGHDGEAVSMTTSECCYQPWQHAARSALQTALTASHKHNKTKLVRGSRCGMLQYLQQW